MIINKDNYTWGSFTYKSDKDVARIDVPVQKVTDPAEALTIYFENSSIAIMWDTLKVNVPVSF